MSGFFTAIIRIPNVFQCCNYCFLLISLFWISGNVYPGFQNYSGKPYLHLGEYNWHTFPTFHLCCDTCQPLDHSQGSQSRYSHAWSTGKIASVRIELISLGYQPNVLLAELFRAAKFRDIPYLGPKHLFRYLYDRKWYCRGWWNLSVRRYQCQGVKSYNFRWSWTTSLFG